MMEANAEMINSLKTIGFFGSTLTSRYRTGLCSSFTVAARELGVNMVYFNFVGLVGDKNDQYGNYEHDLLDSIDFDQFDGIIFDGEGFTIAKTRDSVIEALRRATCPVISITSEVEGFINIKFEDAAGIRMLIEHFIDVHHYTRIGFMSGYLTHPDAQVRLAEFRAVMKERGLPEDGAGVFEGDFWFGKGEAAADYFLSLPERPEAIVCANDYMAISLCAALRKRGLKLPQDMPISGYDGTLEGKMHFPRLTTATRERMDIARRSLELLLKLCEDKDADRTIVIRPVPLFEQSCGCTRPDYDPQLEIFNIINENGDISHNLRLSESAILRLNMVDNVDKLKYAFDSNTSNFGEFDSFFLMINKDAHGRLSFDSDYEGPTGYFEPSIWIDKKEEHSVPEGGIRGNCMVPDNKSDEPQAYYIMSVHCLDSSFGYAVISMSGKDIFNEFYNLWVMNMAMTLDTLQKNDRINKLIERLKDQSIRDGMTGMLNRRGFYEHSNSAILSIKDKRTVCTMVIDMDGLKQINDAYGHYEGDRAIRCAASVITDCCINGEIAARAGGDEFYIFAPDYSQEMLDSFEQRLNELVKKSNESKKSYAELSLSIGATLCESDNRGNLEEFLKISDAKMYAQKHSKPNRRRR